MSTNYYSYSTATCNNPAHGERLHIGKRAGGWQFLFHGHPNKGLTSWCQWQEYLTQNDCLVLDEYGTEISVKDFVEMVRGWNEDPRNSRINNSAEMMLNPHEFGNHWLDNQGHEFSGRDFS